MAVLVLIFWGTSIQFSIMAVAIYIPTKCTRVPFFFLFPFCCSDWKVSTILPSSLLMHSSVSPNLLLISSSVHFISVIVFFSSDLLFLYFLILHWSSHHVPLFFSQVQRAFLWQLFWTLYQVNYLSLFHLYIFLGFIPLSSHFVLLSLLVYMKLGETVTYPSLEGVSLCGSIPMQSACAPWLWVGSWIWSELGQSFSLGVLVVTALVGDEAGAGGAEATAQCKPWLLPWCNSSHCLGR